jgi:uncharacterized protein (TIGR01627 family)
MHEMQHLALAFGRAAASRGQMTPAQYFRIAAEILRRAPCRLLVFGAGRNTELYMGANVGGRTVVLERHPAWIDAVRPLGCEVVRVVYQTRVRNGLVEPCPPLRVEGTTASSNSLEDVLGWLLEEGWDVILVDGPEGYRPDDPGRQQSIALAARLARPGTTVFLHDGDRPLERACAARYLDAPDEQLGERPALLVFRYPPADGGPVCREAKQQEKAEPLPSSGPGPSPGPEEGDPTQPPATPAGAYPAASTRPGPPRLLFCSYHCLVDPSSGAALSTRDLLGLLAARGWPCRALCGPALDAEPDGPFDQRLAGHGLPFTRKESAAGPCPFTLYHFTQAAVPFSVFRPDGSPPSHTPTPAEGAVFLALLERVLEHFRPDLFLTYGGHWLAREAIARASRRGVRVVFALHNFAYHDASLFAPVDGVLVPSAYAQEHYRRTLGLESTAIPGPWDWARVTCASAEGRYVTFVNPQPDKGVFVFARIAHELGRRRPDIPLLVVEGRGKASWLERTGLDLSGLTNLYRMANTPDPRDFYRVSRLVLMPSVCAESFGRVAAEALMNGIPVLASRRGGLPEALAGAGFLLDIPERCTPRSRVVPSAAEVRPWVETVGRLWDDAAEYEKERRRCLAAADAWRPEQLAEHFEGFFRRVLTAG